MNHSAIVAAPAAPQLKPAGRQLLQRQCDCGTHTGGGECESCRKEKLQRKASGGGALPEAGPSVHAVLGSAGRPLDAELRGFMEPRFGRDFSGVRLHTDSAAGASAREVRAHAYTVGQHIVFAPGQYDPRSPRGRRLLAHELAHTVQQAGAGSGALQAKLEVGAEGSAAEVEADRAADAVMDGAAAPRLGSLGLGLSRQVDGQPIREQTVTRGQCQGSGTSLDPSRIPEMQTPSQPLNVQRVDRVSDNERRVVLAGGQRYRVRRTPWTRESDSSSAAPRASADMDQSQAWVEISWCQGTSNAGSVRFGANLPEQLIQLLVNTVSSGGDVSQAWSQASITPNVSGSFRFGNWTFTPSAQVTVDSSGHPTGVQGGLGVERQTPAGGVRVEVQGGTDSLQGNPLQGASGTLNLVFTPGQTPPPPCRTHTVRTGFTYECAQEFDPQLTPHQGARPVTTAARHVHDLYFLYAVPTFDEPRTAQGIAGITADLAAGYQVQGIEAFASPEGPMGPGPGGFMGNDELSRRRAEAARARVAALCGPTASCFAPGATAVGRGERLDPTDPATGQPQDVRGRALEQHVDQAFRTDPEEAPQRDPALMQRLGRTRDLHERAERIYPSLRRASVTMTHTSQGSDPCTYMAPATADQSLFGTCPAGLVPAAFPDSTASGSGSGSGSGS